MSVSRRAFTKLLIGAGAFAGALPAGGQVSKAEAASDYRALVGLFLYGGNDGWNCVVPTDGRYPAYASARGASLALKKEALIPLDGVPFGLHPSLAPVKASWADGSMSVVLNTGSLVAPLTKALYLQQPNLRPDSLMSHANEQAHWETMTMQGSAQDGFLGRLADRLPKTANPSLISLCGSRLALLGRDSTVLGVPSTGTMSRNGFNAAATDPMQIARQAALADFAAAAQDGAIAQRTAISLTEGYAQSVLPNAIISSGSSAVDKYFVDPTTGAALGSDLAKQLLRVARMIEARGTLGQSRQAFMVQQGGYDLHGAQVDQASSVTGTHARLLGDMALAVAGFQQAMKALNLADNVTLFTMSDFGRTYLGNATFGSDHAWGNNHFVFGGAVASRRVHGRYPDQTLGGPEDIGAEGRFIPSIASEEYVGAVIRWFGVAPADMAYIFPNWATWTSAGRGPVPLFG